MRRLGLLLLGALGLACGPVGATENDNHNTNPGGPCSDGETRCSGASLERCQGGAWILQQVCAAPTPACTPDLGCTACAANVPYCDGEAPRRCTAQGLPGEALAPCGEGEACAYGSCISPCSVAATSQSYIGCDYWPTPTANPALDPAFDENFGVVVHNASAGSAVVTITRGDAQVAQATVPGGEIHTFTLPLDTGLKLVDGQETTVKAREAAYHLTSSLPVTVYQFNPLDYQTDAECLGAAAPEAGPPCHSYSNDASLLLPTAVLSTNYLVMARQTYGVDSSGFGLAWAFTPGFVTIVGTENGTTVTVTSTAHTLGGDVAAMTPGATQTFTLDRGEAAQIMSGKPSGCDDPLAGTCDAGPDYDLTGTSVTSSAPVAVFSGHACSFVPYDTWACDHLEEQVLPLETWGKDFIVARTEPQNDVASGYPDPEPNYVRLVSGADGNVLTFDPPQSAGASVTLDRGQWVELAAVADFHVTATGAIMVGQFLVGQNAYTTSYDYWGDPSMSLAVPTEQFRTSYSFLAPSTITYNYVNVVGRVNEGSAPIYLDGAPLEPSAFTQRIGGTEYGVARIPITGTAHTIESTQPFGIAVYGFAAYTSYMYPGGLDLRFINPVD